MTRVQPRLLWPLALAAGIFSPGPARADNLDLELLKQAPGLLRKLNDRKLRNVGVLPFRVKKGARPTRLDTAPLSVSMTTRLENALILANDENERKALGILRDANGLLVILSGHAGGNLAEEYRKFRDECLIADLEIVMNRAERLADVPGVATVFLDRSDIVRHPLVQAIVNAYEEEEPPRDRDRDYRTPAPPGGGEPGTRAGAGLSASE